MSITGFRCEMDSMKNPKTRPQAIATPSICPCSVLNCSRDNSSWYTFRPCHAREGETALYRVGFLARVCVVWWATKRTNSVFP